MNPPKCPVNPAVLADNRKTLHLPPAPSVGTMPQLRMAGFPMPLPDDFRPTAPAAILISGVLRAAQRALDKLPK